MTLTATNYTLSNAYIGNVEYNAYIPVVPQNASSGSTNGTNEEPAVVPQDKFTKYQKVEFYGGFILGILFLIILVLCVIIACMGKNSSTRSDSSESSCFSCFGAKKESSVYKKDFKDAEDIVYTQDRNSLLKEARDQV